MLLENFTQDKIFVGYIINNFGCYGRIPLIFYTVVWLYVKVLRIVIFNTTGAEYLKKRLSQVTLMDQTYFPFHLWQGLAQNIPLDIIIW